MTENDTPLQPGFTRLAILLTDDKTPADIVKMTGLQAEELGHIVVQKDQAFVDVTNDKARDIRDQFAELGPVQVIDIKELAYKWLKLHVGRNHGLTVGHFKKILDKVETGPVGRFNINNTCTVIGIREDYYDQVVAAFEGQKINGIRVRPGPPGPGEAKGNPRFQKSQPRR